MGGRSVNLPGDVGSINKGVGSINKGVGSINKGVGNESSFLF